MNRRCYDSLKERADAYKYSIANKEGKFKTGYEVSLISKFNTYEKNELQEKQIKEFLKEKKYLRGR